MKDVKSGIWDLSSISDCKFTFSIHQVIYFLPYHQHMINKKVGGGVENIAALHLATFNCWWALKKLTAEVNFKK